MSKHDKTYTILMVDDDAEDCLLIDDAVKELRQPHELRFVRDGEELFDYLKRQGEYEDKRSSPYPDLILLDLKMPKQDGRETLRQLKDDAALRRIPVVVLTTSTAPDDVNFCYDVHANAYMIKPDSFRGLVELIRIIGNYWFELAALPSEN
ncbi:MAG: response regulator [Thermoguttaceae bacterium]